MVELDKQELLVLFEFCHRICETSTVAASHPSEVVVINKIAGELERSLSEPFLENYSAILGDARSALLQKYKERMGANAWVEKVPLDQS